MKRRDLVLSALAAAGALLGGRAARAGALPRLGPPAPFDFGRLAASARALAAAPHVPARPADPARLAKIDYSAHWQIRYRGAASLTPAGPEPAVQLFHPGRFFPEPVRVHLVEGGTAREVLFSADYFDMPADSPAHGLPADTGFAGLRVMRPGLEPDWVSFLGASYFRADGPEAQYGLSARGIAVDTGLARPEEFPRFTAFWLASPEREGEALTAYALLDGPSIVGAYRFGLVPEGTLPGQRTDVSAQLFPRKATERLGLAPLTSMYWYSERDRLMADEWRPEIHDSDGLALHTGQGERIWRALQNPATVRTSSFFDDDPRGFGLIQRDRRFESYEDDGVFYNRRPSAWVEPRGRWGRGAVQLVEIPAHDETFDNIVAYWLPERLPEPGETLALDYAIHWTDRDPPSARIAHVVATRQGQGGIPGDPVPQGVDKMVVDFAGPSLAGLDAQSGVEPVIELRGARIAGPVSARPVVGTERWRMAFDFALTGQGPADLRAWLRLGERALTETWITQATVDRSA